MRTYVYRLFAASGQLLYVGCTIYPRQRLMDHQRKPWGSAITRCSWTGFDSENGAYEYERWIIQFEHPIHNRHQVKVPA